MSDITEAEKKPTTPVRSKARREEGWVDLGKNLFKASGVTKPKLDAGIYEIKYNEQLGLLFAKKNIKTDKLIEFPDMVQDDVIKSIEQFWGRKEIFTEYGQLHKRGLFIYGKPGCHIKGTEVIKYDGSLVKVEDVVVGEKLMGPDSTPRKVTELKRGRGKLYKIIPVKGEPFTVNEDHVLSLIKSGFSDEPINITVKEYLTKSFHWKSRHKLYRANTIGWNKTSSLPIPPYVLGLWLGDGSSKTSALTSQDEGCIKDWYNWITSEGCAVSESFTGNAITLSAVSPIKGTRNNCNNKLRSLGLLGDRDVSSRKHIPAKYLTASIQDRLELLAGILDADGCLSNKGFDIILKNKVLSDNVLFLARSLGLAAYQSQTEKSCMYLGERKTGVYWRISISGNTDSIPNRIAYKQAGKRLQIKNPLYTGFTVEPAGRGDYYGFSLTGDQLYLLNDFTVTHNSGKTCTINILSKKLVALGGIVVYCTNPYLATEGLNAIRRIEADRPIIYVMEDIDEMLRQHGDQSLLSLLDGENKIENIVYVATSNYPELLSERFLDRPSRFDELIHVDMPSPEARGIYLRSVMNEEQLPVQLLHQWVADTANFSIAHLRELFVSVKCLDRTYEESLERLRGMSTLPKSTKKRNAGKLGFDSTTKSTGLSAVKYSSTPIPELGK